MGSASGKSMYIREAHHAGSWYESDPRKLDATLTSFLEEAAATTSGADEDASPTSTNLRALIVPHAGYSYSGPTAAYSYTALAKELTKKDSPIRKILVLHPSHHVYLEGCAVSGAESLETPLGNLRVDDDLRQEVLRLSPKFTIMKAKVDEEEHSGEMQYPYLAKVLQGRDISVLPVMCGALSVGQEEFFGKLLGEIVARPDVVTVVSSDFCHWGARFSFRPTNDGIPIHKFIEQMDRKGMDLIELQQPGAFADYLKETRNTICGRHAIAVWLRAVTTSSSRNTLSVSFVHYAQSSAAKSMSDSSVSYAAAVATSK